MTDAQAKFEAETLTTSFLAERLRTDDGERCDKCSARGHFVVVNGTARAWLCEGHMGDIPEEPLRPEFRDRLLATVNRALAVRRSVLALAVAATGHRIDRPLKTCRVCKEVWPCREVLRAAAPVLNQIADHD